MRILAWRQILFQIATASVCCGIAASQDAAIDRSPLVPWVTRQMTFNIPFTVPTEGRLPLAIELYVSEGSGKPWELVARQRPDAGHFQFRTDHEGYYLFAPQSVHGLRQPAKPAEFRPELAVLVDLQEPKFSFEARVAPSGEVETTWEATDLSLQSDSLTVEYLPQVGQAWKPVALDAQQISATEESIVGRMTWWPDTNSNSIHVRAEISDRAGNKAVVNRLVLLHNNPAQSANNSGNISSTVPPAGSRSQHEIVRNQATTWPADNQLQTRPLPDHAAARTLTAVPAIEFTGDRPSTPSRYGSSAQSLAVDDQQWRSSFPPEVPAVQSPVGTQYVAKRDSSSEPPSAEPQPRVPASATFDNRVSNNLGARRKPRMTRRRRFELDYDVDAVGPSGIRKVELWGTGDDGRTWSLWQTDENATSPIEIVVEQDGVYGFGIVIVSNSGLAGPTPRNGDPADFWVKVDTKLPRVRLTSATYGDGDHAGHLQIQWRSTDASFGDTPISLSYSESPSGPWTTIATGLANTEKHYWKVDPRVPKQIYLRIEARDEAGNVAQFQLSNAVNLAGLTPTARIRGIRPL
jgi:hypothetical protein